MCLLLGSVIGCYLPKRPMLVEEEELVAQEQGADHEGLDELDRII